MFLKPVVLFNVSVGSKGVHHGPGGLSGSVSEPRDSVVPGGHKGRGGFGGGM